MALVSYAEVQAKVARYLWDRDDLTADIVDAIVLCEARLNNILRCAQMETSGTITLTSGSGSLPSDYLQWRRVVTQDSPVRVLEFAEPDWALEMYPDTAAAPSCYFTIIGSTIKTFPTSSANLTMHYYQKIPALVSNTAGNWVTSRSPGLYIYGTLLELAPFLDDDPRLTTWGQMFERGVSELETSDIGHRYAKAAMRPVMATP